MKLRFGNWLPATLAACALIVGAEAMAQPSDPGNGGTAAASPKDESAAPGDAVRYVRVKSGTPYTDKNSCTREDEEFPPWLGYRIGADTATEISRIDFTGNKLFNREQLLGRILSQEFHWYRLFSADYVSFRGPAQSRALLELKGVIANEDFGYIKSHCGPNDFGKFKGFSKVRDIVSLQSFIVSAEHLYNPDLVGADAALIQLNYWRHGFINAEVTTPTPAAASGGGNTLTYAITEGERYRFGKVALATDIDGYDPEDLRYAVDIRNGDWYDPVATNDLAARLDSVKFSSLPLFKALHEHLPFGICVEPDSTVDEAGKAVDVTLTVTRCTTGDGKSFRLVHAKPVAKPAPVAESKSGKRLGVAHRKPAAAAPSRQVGALPAPRIGMASAGDAQGR